jgi:hypothetical protein
MKIPKKTGIALFAYNRPSHLRRVLIALEDYNIRNVEIFIDGPKDRKDLICQDEIMFMLKTSNKIKYKIHRSKKNKGLSKSIEFGMNYMSSKYSNFIVLEDDCIPRKQFFNFIIKCINTYEKRDDIQAICGYQLPELHLKNGKVLKSILLRNFMSWGWATWSKKYQDYKKNYIKSKIKKSSIIKKIEELKINQKNVWTLDLIKYCFLKKKYFIFPNKSQIKNIGFDGSGVNSKSTFKFNTYYTNSKKFEILKNLSLDLKKSKIQDKIIKKRVKLFY